MIDVDEAGDILMRHVRPGPTVVLPLDRALHRTLAAPIQCDIDCPPFDRSVMDGYAVRAEDVSAAPVVLKVVGQVAAGVVTLRVLGPGEAVQINTGASIPPAADAVVRVEETELRDEESAVLIRTAVDRGQFITCRGAYKAAGEVVLRPGDVLTPVNVGVAATVGASRVTVYRPPRVAVIASGDELIGIDAVPAGAQVRNSNQYVLAALVASAHADPVVLGTVGDDRAALTERIEVGLASDVLCITGGVSMGAFDLVPEVLEQVGAQFHVRKMAIKPGRPTLFATTAAGTLIFALPGNPISAFVGFELLVRPALAALQGRPRAFPPMVRATLHGRLEATGERRSYRPGRAWVSEDGGWAAEPLSWHGSGDALGTATATALLMRPPRAPQALSGDSVAILLLDRE